MQYNLKTMFFVSLLLLPAAGQGAPARQASNEISLIPSSVEAKRSTEILPVPLSMMEATPAELAEAAVPPPAGPRETGDLHNFLPPTITRAPGSLLVDSRASNPLFATDATLAADISQLFKSSYGYLVDQKTAEAQARITDDSGSVFIAMAGALFVGGSLLYWRARRNRNAIKAAIRELRQSKGVRRRRSGRKSRTVGRR
jgi:LPXTG-motif cell wall-anchored protein